MYVYKHTPHPMHRFAFALRVRPHACTKSAQRDEAERNEASSAARHDDLRPHRRKAPDLAPLPRPALFEGKRGRVARVDDVSWVGLV